MLIFLERSGVINSEKLELRFPSIVRVIVFSNLLNSLDWTAVGRWAQYGVKKLGSVFSIGWPGKGRRGCVVSVA